MNKKLGRLVTLFGFTLLLMFLLVNAKAQDLQQPVPSKRTKDNFDFSWQFHKGDIAIKKVLKAGGQGGITDVNVEVISKDTLIDYTNSSSYKL